MARKFAELEAKMSPESRSRSDKRYRELLKEMPLEQLRNARRLTQVQLAEAMHVDQSAVSRIEKRTDMYISTLANFIEAMGGKLEIRAIFPDGEARISQFKELINSE
jgi:DNA-binding XRE family transcriptional regulator